MAICGIEHLVSHLELWLPSIICRRDRLPCISDDHVGGGRSYVRLDEAPVGDTGYKNWIAGLQVGDSYAGDGRSHVFDFAVSAGDAKAFKRELSLKSARSVHVAANVSARLQPDIDEASRKIQNTSPFDRPYWHIERARIGASRNVPVELIVNGIAVKRVEIEADGAIHPIAFDLQIEKSSWLALRVLPSVHTNPFYVIVDDRPVRASRRSAEWCRKAVDVCWEQKVKRIRPSEVSAAQNAFEHARTTYDAIITEASVVDSQTK